MGKTKINIVSDEPKQKLSSEEEYKLKQAKKAEKTKEEKARPERVERVHLSGLKGGQKLKLVSAEPVQDTASAPIPTQPRLSEELPTKAKAKKQQKTHSKKYLSARAKVDPTKAYPVGEAAQLVKETSISKFDGSVELHLALDKEGIDQNVDLPNPTGKTNNVEIASDETVKKLEAGKLDFDILLASPPMMPKLVRFAKLLGPKGLMPNPKNGTLVDNPEKALAKFTGNSIRVKTEKDAPLVHLVVAKVSQPESEIEQNIKAVINDVGLKTVKKAVVSASMGPGIRLTI